LLALIHQSEEDRMGLILQGVTDAIDRLICKLWLIGDIHVRNKDRKAANHKLEARYGKNLDHSWKDNDFQKGELVVSCLIGAVPVDLTLDTYVVPNGDITVLWPLNDGAHLPITGSTLEAIKTAIEDVVEVVLHGSGYTPQPQLALEPPAEIAAIGPVGG
jgi:hypothetical protein